MMKLAIALLAVFAVGCHAQGFRVASPLNVESPGSSTTINGITGSSTQRGSIIFTSTGVTVFNAAGVGLKVFDTTGNVQVKDSSTDQGYAFFVHGNIYSDGNITCAGSCGGGSTGYALIQNNGAAITARTTLNFVSGVTCVDDPGNTRSNCTASGGGSLPVVDSTALVYKTGDATATVSIDASLVTPGTNRALKMQNASYTAAGLEQVQTFTATNTMRDVNPSANNTYRLGTDTGPFRWYELNANRINGIQSGLTNSDNYLLTREVRFVDQAGGTNSWNARTSAPSGLAASTWSLFDNAGADTLILSRVQAGVVTNNAEFDLNVIPFITGTRSLGSSGRRWLDAYVTNLNASGTVTLSGITGSTQCLTVNSSGVISGTGVPCGAGSGGANTTLSNLGTTAVNAAIAPATSNSIGLGDGTHNWSSLWAAQLGSSTASTLAIFSATSQAISLQPNGAEVLRLNSAGTAQLSNITGSTQCLQVNSSGVISGSGVACGGSGGANTALSNLASVAINTSLLPGTDDSITLGSGSLRFRGASFENDTNSNTVITARSQVTGAVAAALRNTSNSQSVPTLSLQNDTGLGLTVQSTSGINSKFFGGNVLINLTSQDAYLSKLQIDPGSSDRGLSVSGSTTASPMVVFANTSLSGGFVLGVSSRSTTGAVALDVTSAGPAYAPMRLGAIGGYTAQFFVTGAAPSGACNDGSVTLRTDAPNGRIYVCRNAAWVAGF